MSADPFTKIMSPGLIKSHCNKCGGETKHDVLHEEKRSGVEQYDAHAQLDWWMHHRLLRCAGCDTISLRIDSGNSELEDDEGRPEVRTQHYPPRIFRPKPLWASDADFCLTCPFAIQELLDEVYIALQNDCARAAAMVVRALLERICVSVSGDHGTFKNNLDAFQSAGHLSPTQRQLVDTVLDAGHAATHRSFKPSRDDLSTVVDIVESLVKLLYVQTHKVEQLKTRVPPRKKS